MKKPSEAPWKTISTKPIYSNRWLSLREDVAELPDGRTTIYGVVTCGDCVGVLTRCSSSSSTATWHGG
jgi:ADP-ribose pyrophosphatase